MADCHTIRKREFSLSKQHFYNTRVKLYQWFRRRRLKSMNVWTHVRTHNIDHPELKTSSVLICKSVHTDSQNIRNHITKTYLYNFDPLKPHFYIVKLGLQGYTLFLLFLLKSIDCGYSLEPPRRGGFNECPQSMFRAEIWKIWDFFFIWKVAIFWW